MVASVVAYVLLSGTVATVHKRSVHTAGGQVDRTIFITVYSCSTRTLALNRAANSTTDTLA
jgi:hypothetical protein